MTYEDMRTPIRKNFPEREIENASSPYLQHINRKMKTATVHQPTIAFVLTVCDLPLQVTTKSSLFEHRKMSHSLAEFSICEYIIADSNYFIRYFFAKYVHLPINLRRSSM